MNDVELASSLAWQAKVEHGEAEWSRLLFQLSEKISIFQTETGAMYLMALGSYLDLEVPVSLDVKEKKFQLRVTERVEEFFDQREFRRVIEEKTRTRWVSYPRSVDNYLGEFLVERPRYLQGLIAFVDLIPENLKIVEAHIDDLTQAEREHKPYAGGISLSKWRGYTRSYANQHLKGIAPQDFFPDHVPRYIKEYRAGEMGVAGARFLWSLLECARTIKRLHEPSTSAVGIAFERKLIQEISDTYPEATLASTPPSGDQGADAILTVDGVKIVIQAKKYTGVVGNAAVQEVFAAKEFYDADYGMVVTTSRYTPAASSLATKLGVALANDQDYLQKIRQMLV